MLKNRTYIALAALILVGGATLWKVTRPDPHAADGAGSAAPGFHVAKADVDELAIAEPKKPEVILKKDGAEWKLAAPVADRADQKAVDQALDALETVKLKDVIAENPESYDKVGVKDDDVVKVVAKKGGKAVATLLVGKTTNVRLEGDPKVYSTANLKRWALVKEPRYWRDRMIVEIPADKLEKVVLEYPNGAKIVVAKEEAPPPPKPADDKAPPPPKAPDRWVVVEGKDAIGGELDPSLAQSVATGISRVEADDFADGADPSTTGLDKPRTTVVAYPKEGPPKILLIGKDDGQDTYLELKDGTRVWKIHKYEADKFPTSPAQWRDKTIVKVDPASVTKIEIAKDKERTVLERTGDKTWKATTPADLGEVDVARVDGLLRTAQSLRATKIVEGGDPKSLGLDKPRAVVTLTRKDGGAVKLTIGPAQKSGDTPVAVAGQKDVYTLADYQVAAFVKEPKDFKKSAAPQAAMPPGHM